MSRRYTTVLDGPSDEFLLGILSNRIGREETVSETRQMTTSDRYRLNYIQGYIGRSGKIYPENVESWNRLEQMYPQDATVQTIRRVLDAHEQK